MGIILTPVSDLSHESNGAKEYPKRTSRSWFNRLRACHQRGVATDIFSEATYAKNISGGNLIASALELIYGRRPLISDSDILLAKIALPTVREHSANIPLQRIRAMIWENIRDPAIPKIGDTVYIRR